MISNSLFPVRKIWRMMQGSDLFETDAMRDEDSNYDTHRHLVQIISYLGPPPRELVMRERQCRGVMASESVINSQGKLCNTVCEYWGGPFFDDDGE